MDELEKWLRSKGISSLVLKETGFREGKDSVMFLTAANLLASNRAEIETLKEMVAEMQK